MGWLFDENPDINIPSATICRQEIGSSAYSMICRRSITKSERR
jgi:hypothetical protein